MTSEWPKVMASGGNSPSEVASEVTEGMVVMFIVAQGPVLRNHTVHPESQTPKIPEFGLDVLLKSFAFMGLHHYFPARRQPSKAHLRGARAGGPVGKTFHRTEATFLGRERLGVVWATSGWENLSPIKW